MAVVTIPVEGGGELTWDGSWGLNTLPSFPSWLAVTPPPVIVAPARGERLCSAGKPMPKIAGLPSIGLARHWWIDRAGGLKSRRLWS